MKKANIKFRRNKVRPARELRDLAYEIIPALEERLPLYNGVGDDIKAKLVSKGLSQREAGVFIERHFNSTHYLTNLFEFEVRYDLDGVEHSPITTDQRYYVAQVHHDRLVRLKQEHSGVLPYMPDEVLLSYIEDTIAEREQRRKEKKRRERKAYRGRKAAKIASEKAE
ncbi:ProQ/FINO family protein [Vibrio breoganii]